MKSRTQGGRRPLRSAVPPPVPFTGATYLYGIVRLTDAKRKSFGVGVGEPPRDVKAYAHRDVAALVSEVHPTITSTENVRAMRRDMKAHATVLNRAAENATVLPARYGLVFPCPAALVSRFLEPQYPAIFALLNKLDGTVEVTLRATYIEEQILSEVLAAHPELARAGRAAGYQTRIDLGQRIAAEIENLRGRDGRWLTQQLSPAARDIHITQLVGELGVLNASFLVERSKMDEFDRKLSTVHSHMRNRLRFECVGPLPPYSFVNFRIR